MNYHKRYGYEPYYAQILDFTKMLFCFLYLEFMFQSIKKKPGFISWKAPTNKNQDNFYLSFEIINLKTFEIIMHYMHLPLVAPVSIVVTL